MKLQSKVDLTCSVRGKSPLGVSANPDFCKNVRVKIVAPLFVCKYVDENGLPAILAAKRSASVTPEMNHRIPLCTGNEACKRGDPSWLVNPGQTLLKFETGPTVAPRKGVMSSKFF